MNTKIQVSHVQITLVWLKSCCFEDFIQNPERIQICDGSSPLELILVTSWTLFYVHNGGNLWGFFFQNWFARFHVALASEDTVTSLVAMVTVALMSSCGGMWRPGSQGGLKQRWSVIRPGVEPPQRVPVRPARLRAQEENQLSLLSEQHRDSATYWCGELGGCSEF